VIFRSRFCMYVCFASSEGLDGSTVILVRRLQHEQLNEEETARLMEETFDARQAWIRSC
jgi:aspartate carbamoyltransferase catalytic subunit